MNGNSRADEMVYRMSGPSAAKTQLKNDGQRGAKKLHELHKKDPHFLCRADDEDDGLDDEVDDWGDEDDDDQIQDTCT